jgi:hypothetical protein
MGGGFVWFVKAVGLGELFGVMC